MPAVTVTADLKTFHAQIERMVVEFKKDAAKELNKRAIQVLIGSKGFKGAVHFTKKATSARIKSDLNRKYYVAGRRGNKSGGDVKLLWILASKRITKNGGGKGLPPAAYRAKVAAVADNIWHQRNASRAFLAAGWLNCVRQLEGAGLNTLSGKAKAGVSLHSHGRASKSWARGAVPGRLIAQCWNAAAEPGTAAGNIVEQGLAQGINAQIADMEKYFQMKLEKSLQKHAD